MAATVEFTVSATSSASAEEVLRGARDFSQQRIEVWPNVSARGYEVHAAGETFAEVTESALQGLFWERSRYEWAHPDHVRQYVLDSNALAPGSTWEITATANGGGCHVETTFRRSFKRGLKGGIAYFVNRFCRGLYASDLRRMLRTIEAQ